MRILIALSVWAAVAAHAAGPRQFIYSSDETLLAETTSGSNGQPRIDQEYVWFGDLPVAQFDDGSARWTFADHLGTPVLQTGTSANVLWRVESEPFGAQIPRAGAALRQPLRFPGQESDDASPERVYNVERWYRPEWGRYTQADPMESPNRNAYAYADADPLRFSDPLGLYATDAKTYVHEIADLTPKTKCGSEFACTRAFAKVTCNCKCQGPDHYSADPTLEIHATIFYFSGKWQSIHETPVADPSVKDAASAVAHEHARHLDVAIADKEVDRLMRELEAKQFKSEPECKAACHDTSVKVRDAFGKKLQETQRNEHRK